MNVPKGLFITIEGGEGAGKTTLIRSLAKELQARGRSVLTTREPGGIPIAEKIRSVILDKTHTSMDARTEALLYAAARRQHLVEKVVPALEAGQWVICDRFIDSSLAYQGYARGLGIEDVWSINRYAIGEWMPDATLWLDVPPELGLARIAASSEREVNRLDLETEAFHRRVQEGYRLLHEQEPRRIFRLDASLAPDSIQEQAMRVLWPLQQESI
ncbi:dTMP kinase [Paenibacillus albicereus]|uniref:Thymidylate kinase n=1 Tax=Paenibacillus albicereus TaxID=2726185 RepID=A0A6H2GRZ3_9BACL|nr:dTMP kinase [Paenibacillus albicereus]QJC50165.1 dTMP kinase [Paenibacillus albicereus]